MAAKESVRPKVVKGDILEHLGLDPQKTMELKVKADLHRAILSLIQRQKFSSRDLERILSVPQPRVSELTKGKLSVLSIGKLLWYAERLGGQTEISIKAPRRTGRRAA